jgi:hypothetical protein
VICGRVPVFNGRSRGSGADSKYFIYRAASDRSRQPCPYLLTALSQLRISCPDGGFRQIRKANFFSVEASAHSPWDDRLDLPSNKSIVGRGRRCSRTRQFGRAVPTPQYGGSKSLFNCETTSISRSTKLNHHLVLTCRPNCSCYPTRLRRRFAAMHESGSRP